MKDKSLISKYYKKLSGRDPIEIVPLPRSGSDRKYYRVVEPLKNVIAAINTNTEENDTFVGFTQHFRKQNLPVPEIIEYYRDANLYFQSDLGDTNLFTWLERKRHLSGFGDAIIRMYKKVLEELVNFQLKAIRKLDLNLCYPHQSFDAQSMTWDMNYFKYMFVKLAAVPFNEKRLERDFDNLRKLLLKAGNEFFLYRDFQSANIMIVDGEPWFIDYQGGRSGAPQYDVASLLYDSKAHIPQQAREILLEYYIEKFTDACDYDELLFRELYPAFVLVRIMQALGAYGYRGLFEQKPGFVQSIIPAVRDISYILDTGIPGSEFPELKKLVDAIQDTRKFEALKQPETLRIKISSFSYMNGLPVDAVHGGGYIYDCRSLVNPGKKSEFRYLTGLDNAVAQFMETDPGLKGFIDDAYSMVERSVKSYKKKNYTSLAVSFGCTGGRHRSVYCAERFAEKLRQIEGIDIEIIHRDID
ncbi:MAG: RNase adapter RapZ [Marinilabiliaceae bacterium]|jgi:aminoglycoside/choline kinase family phosphotransferase|nr:RNase adapter RapZ [Marinilabiliaceae bacterium]